MNALNLARNAYASPAAPVRTDRATEHDAFAKVTHKLRSLNQKSNPTEFVNALHDNRQLWTLLAVDVADESNKLPQSLRAQIFYLAEFTDQHTSKVLAGKADTLPLVDINTAIMAGLRQNGKSI